MPKKDPRVDARPVVVPEELAAALARNEKAREWIAEAKTDETRQRRVVTALEWMAEGRSRNWKYTRTTPASRKT